MEPYNSYKYYFPPRPETKAPPAFLDRAEKMNFLAQPKLNGSCSVVSTNGSSLEIRNRRNEHFANDVLDRNELKTLSKNAWSVFAGELMNKSQRDSNGKLFNKKLVIFDILVLDGLYLVGSSFEERCKMIQNTLHLKECENEHLFQISENVYYAKTFDTGFKRIYDEITKYEMYEGLVLKRKDAKLAPGLFSANNTSWQIKVRKTTKNYSY